MTTEGRSRTNTEESLLEIWKAVLGTTIGVTDGFFELGGDSLTAYRILSRVETVLGKRLRFSVFFDAPTVQGMAALIDSDTVSADGVHVCCLKAHGSKIPVFWIPGGAGLCTTAFQQISSLIGVDRPVYGLEASIGQSRKPTDLRVKARSYVEALRAQWPTGPYYLLGFSAGSWLAYEMAVQLEALSQESLLVIFDMTVPGYPGFVGKVGTGLEVVRLHCKRLLRRPISGWIPFTKHIIQDKVQRMRADSAIRTWNGMEDGMDLFTVAEYQNSRAIDAYRVSNLPKFSGDVRVVLASESIYDGLARSLDPRLGWCRLTRGRLDVFRVHGNHSSMLQEPHVKALAGTLKLILSEADNGCASVKELSPQMEASLSFDGACELRNEGSV
jgi:thioesterase domain-containing protein